MKRLMDIAGSLAGLLIFLPIMLIAAAMIRVILGAPVLVVQERPGLGGKPFNMLKFRTMTDAVDENNKLLPSDQRLTPLGRFFRATSIDELPGLVNVLKGDMSLVGPRPLLMSYLQLYTPEQARRHQVRPGLTGWAQIHGRNAVEWDERFRLDVWYVDNHSLKLDMAIIAKTIALVFRRTGVNANNGKIMEKFKGSGQ